MITSLRNALKYTVTKVILAALICSFVFFSAGDIFLNRRNDIAFKVGDIEYTKKEWISFYQAQLNRLGDEYKNLYSQEELQSAFLRQIINSMLIEQEAKKLSLLISDDAVKYHIINSMPSLLRDGKFDKDALSGSLKKMGISEATFIRHIKTELMQRTLMDTITHGSLLNSTLLDQLVKSLYSQRDVELFEADFSNFHLIAEPTQEDLQKTLDQYVNMFTVPELRKVTFLKFDIDNSSVVEEDVSQEEAKTFYENNKYLFQMPEKRTLLKMIFANKDEAEETYKKLTGGDDFVAIAKQLKQDVIGNSITVTKDGFEEHLSQAIFSLNLNAFSQPIQTPLGWTIFKIIAIVPPAMQPFNDVRAEIEKQIIESRCYDRYLSKIKNIDLDIQNHISIEQISKKYDLKLEEAELKAKDEIEKYNSNAHDEKQILANKSFAEAVFSLQNGTTSNVLSSIPDSQSFVVRVDKVAPGYVKSLDSIKSRLIAIWRQTQIQIMAENTLIQARESIDKSGSIDDLKNIKVTKQRLSIIDNKFLPDDQIVQLFTMPINSFSPIVQSIDGFKRFFKVTGYIEPDALLVEKNKADEEQKIENLKSVLVNDYFNYLKKIYKIEIKDISVN